MGFAKAGALERPRSAIQSNNEILTPGARKGPLSDLIGHLQWALKPSNQISIGCLQRALKPSNQWISARGLRNGAAQGANLIKNRPGCLGAVLRRGRTARGGAPDRAPRRTLENRSGSPGTWPVRARTCSSGRWSAPALIQLGAGLGGVPRNGDP